MSQQGQRSRIAVAICAATGALAFGVAGCGGGEEDTVDPGSAGSDSALTTEEATAPLDAAPELTALRAQANEILDEGVEEFEARLAELEGTPVVVNKWASWCGPCREEFPYFQAQAIEREDDVAFVGLLSNDGPETGATFLERLPLPYPSYLDSDLEIADSLAIGREFPTTLFYDSSGEVAFTKIGPYESEEALAADIERYAN